MEQQTTTTDTTPAPAPAPTSDEARYAALKAELGLDKEEAQPEPEVDGRDAEPGPEAQPEPEVEPQHVPRAEHENIQKALREAREQAQAAKAEKAAILDLIERSRRQPEVKNDEPAKIPDVLEDPIKHYDARIAQLESQVQQGQLTAQQAQQQLQAHQYEQQLIAAVTHYETEIRDPRSPNHKADYNDACEWLEGARIRQLDIMYPDDNPHAQQLAAQYRMTPQQFKVALLNNDRRSVATHALQHGTSPAEHYYNLALASGYQAKPNGKTIDVKADRGKLQIEAAKRGQKAAVTISGGEGRKTTADMSLTELNALRHEDPDAYDKAWEEMKRSGRLG